MTCAGAEEVGPNDGFGPPGGGGDFVHVERRGVRREHRFGFRDLLEAGEDLAFHADLLEHRLHEEVGPAQVLKPVGPADPRHPAFRLRGFDLPSAHRS